MKEPRYLTYPEMTPRYVGPGADRVASHVVTNRADYLALFAACPAGFVTGEASPDYLMEVATPQTASRLVPDARLIAILRHPVDRAYSQFLHERHLGKEPCASFEQAWEAGDARIAQGWRPVYAYRQRGFYGAQLTRWLEHFPREQLLILFYEDWRTRPADVLAQVWRHLGLEPMDRPVVTEENVSSREPRWTWLQRRLADEEHPARRLARRMLPLWVRDVVTRTGDAISLRPGPPLDPALRAKLARVYHDDLTTLEALTGRDLTHWRH